MKITSADITLTEVDLAKFPQDGKFEIVLIGKSNVGKSSFINCMLGRKSLARTSSQPGKTRTANFYIVNDEFYFVDMPGYGYAKVAKTQRLEFSKIIKDYIRKRDTDFIVFFLLDNRHEPTNNDKEMFEYLRSEGINPVVILTKCDKVKSSERASVLKQIKAGLKLEPDDLVFEFSSVTSKGKDQIWEFIESILEDDEEFYEDLDDEYEDHGDDEFFEDDEYDYEYSDDDEYDE
ncbi:MAG: YihA family ribosome biogenesis GTP-binding protein [Anaerofustis stercorihominis]|nr:YihA family ribosome biogenesis GTP-binding protein [Anaerofustis stercorihominis]